MTHYTLMFILLFITLPGIGQTDFENWKYRGEEAILAEDYPKALYAMERAEQFISQEQSLIEKAEFYNNLGLLYYETGSYKKGIEQCTQSLELYRRVGIDTLIAESMYNLGISYKDLGLLEHSMDYLLKSARIFEHEHSTIKLASAWNSMGNIYRDTKEFDKAIVYHYKALRIRQEGGYAKGIADSYQNLGSVYLEWGKYDQAEFFLLKALKEKINLKQINIVTTYSSLGRLYLVRKDYKKAESYLTKAYELRVAGGNSVKSAESLLYLAKYYISVRENEKALELFQQIEGIAQLKKNYQLLTEALEGQIALLERSANQKWLISRYKKLLTSREKEALQTNKKEVDRLEIEYDVERKNRELTLHRKQSRIDQLRFRQLVLVLIGVLIIAVATWVAYYYIRRSKRKIECQKEEIEYLHQELSHRTKNYFGLLSGMLKMDRKQAKNQETVKVLDQTIRRLGAMSLVQHYLLDETTRNNKEVELGAYFRNLTNTLVLSLFSTGDQLGLIQNYEQVYVDYDRAMRLAIVLNELVCNAIEHGLVRTNKPELQVSVQEEAKQLKIIVKDNGIGMEPVLMDNPDSKGITLVSRLLQYLGGTLTYSNENGCTATVLVKM